MGGLCGRPLWEAKGGFGCRAGKVENPEKRLELLLCCLLALPWPSGKRQLVTLVQNVHALRLKIDVQSSHLGSG